MLKHCLHLCLHVEAARRHNFAPELPLKKDNAGEKKFAPVFGLTEWDITEYSETERNS